jgi:F5/8 type C domain
MRTPPAARPSHTRAVARLDLPANPSHDTIALYRATEHQRPLLNGYSGYFAPHYWPLEYLVSQHDPAVLTRMSSFGALEVVVDRDLDEGGQLEHFVANHPQASRVYEEHAYASFRIERGPHVGPLPKLEGEPLPIAAFSSEISAGLLRAMTDGDLVTRWHAAREQRPGDAFVADLGGAHVVNGVVMMIGGFNTDFPRSLAIDTSIDGSTWIQAWRGTTGLMALSGALEDPLSVPMPIEFAPHQVRYLRFTQLVSEEKYYWSIAELRVMGK